MAGRGDESVRVWTAVTVRRAVDGPLGGHAEAVYSVGWSPDGSKIVSGSEDKTVRVWDAATGQPALDRPLEGHAGVVCSAGWSPDRSKIVSGSGHEAAQPANCTVRLRAPAIGQQQLATPPDSHTGEHRLGDTSSRHPQHWRNAGSMLSSKPPANLRTGSSESM